MRSSKRGLLDNSGHRSGSLSAKRLSLRRSNLRGSHSVCSSTSTSITCNNVNIFSSSYFDLGDSKKVCEFCGALFWHDERLKSHPLSQGFRYNQCCRRGTVRLCSSPLPPDCIIRLFERDDFQANVRAYNSMFAMTSFGASVDHSVNLKHGPYVFKVSGQVCHNIGSVCPPIGEKPRFLQMYVYDTEHELSNRLRFFTEHGESSLDRKVVSLLLRTLDSVNELVKLFRTARDLCLSGRVPDFAIRLYSDSRDKRYGPPTDGSIGAIVYEPEPHSSKFDIIIRTKQNTAQRVSKLHKKYMSLQYPLLFIYGEDGWGPSLRLFSNDPTECKQLSMTMYYRYLLHDRFNVYTHLLRGGRLFQQFLVDAYVCIEQNRLDYVATHQDEFRTEHLQGVQDAFASGDTDGQSIGKRVVLPSSFTGGPRYMYKHYQDALAICRVYGNPQYFITFTCNVRWPEIVRHVSSMPSVKVQDRADIIARVFKMKVDAFVKYLRSGEPFGEVIAELYTIEFQKRGLPHCHTLLWVSPSYKIKSPIEIDRYISAQIPDAISEPILHKIVTESMLHGPCGFVNPKASCMINNVCSKGFPKSFESCTRFDSNGYAQYKRVLNGVSVEKSGATMDDSMVVPYNPMLLLRFAAHVNVECCGWNMLIKYLFKYISKGADRVHFSVSKETGESSRSTESSVRARDEIKSFVDGRYICPHEAAWRILEFPIHNRNPSVQVLAVHLENMQNVKFKDSEMLEAVLDDEDGKCTTLTEWLVSNRDPKKYEGRCLSYVDYVSMYRWDASKKIWIRRSYNKTPAVGRLIYIHPSSGETFYLRMLLCHQTGCGSFVDIRTVDGVVCPTYRSACERLGLLNNDNEWTYAISEAASWATSKELRSLFVHMLLFCEVSDPVALWEKHWRSMSDDIFLTVERHTGFRPSYLSDNDIQQYVLFELELLLNASGNASTLSEFGISMPRADFAFVLKNRLLMEEKNYDTQMLADQHQVLKNALHPQQLVIYETVVKSVLEGSQVMLFVYGHGGTGKTYLWTTIICALRSIGNVVLAVAASGIASLLLPSGRTAHSRFKLPLNPTDDSFCYVKKNTQLAKLLTETSLIIWDEAPMSDRRSLESLDRTLRDILDNPSKPFGGKSVLLGGDFRQTLPVKSKAPKSEIISMTLPRSLLWRHFKVHMLTENMRLHRQNLSESEKADIAWFSAWLLSVGDGKIGDVVSEDDPDTKRIEVPNRFLLPSVESSVQELIRFIYDEETLANPSITAFSDKAIICPKNKTADHINDLVLSMCKGESYTYFSSDSIQAHAGHVGDSEDLYPPEYLNSLSFNGFPPHRLELKPKTPIILLRNINQPSGLCNGTRLLVTRLLPKVIEALVITGTAIGHRVYIPRITLLQNDENLPFIFRRKQFPVKVCYAMTINKSQGQSLGKIGVYLPEPAFGHGQLYVALSRATSINSIKILIIPAEGDTDSQTRNIVYSDFLRSIHYKNVWTDNCTTK